MELVGLEPTTSWVRSGEAIEQDLLTIGIYFAVAIRISA